MAKTAIVTALVGAYILFGLATLTEFPLVWEDEPWYTQSSWAFTQQGSFALPMFAGVAGYERDNVAFGRTYLAAVAAIYEVAGADPFASRVASFICGLIALAATYGIGRELWSRRTGIIAAVFLAVAPNFVRQTHDARPEIMLVAAWTTALYLVLSGDRKGARWRVLMAGLLASLAGDTHFNGLIVAPALLLLLIIRRSPRRTLVLYCVGVVVGVAWWLWVHLLQDPQLFMEQVRLNGRDLPITNVLVDPIVTLGTEVARYVFVEPFGSSLLAAFAIVAAAVLVATRRDTAVTSLLVFSGVIFLFMALFTGARTPIYAVLLWPVAALLVARHIDIAPRPLALATGCIVVAVSLGSIGAFALELFPSDYDRYVSKLRAVIPPNVTLQAHPTVWFGFQDQPFYATQYFMWAGPYEDVVRRLGVGYVIADDFHVPPGCSSCRASMPAEIRSFLEQHAELVAEVEDPYYGRVRMDDRPGFVSRVYRITD